MHLVARGAGKRYKQAKLSFHLAKQKDRGANSQKGRIQHELDAAMNGYRQICALLIRRGCSRTRADVNGMTPLMVAAMEGAVGLMGVLVTGNATGKRGNGGEEEEEEMLRLIEVEDNSGNTAMHYAMAFKQISAANALEVRRKHKEGRRRGRMDWKGEDLLEGEEERMDWKEDRPTVAVVWLT